MTPPTVPAHATEMESYPVITRLLYDRLHAGRSADFEAWTTDARTRLEAHAGARPNPKLRKDVDKILHAYDLTGQLLEGLEALARHPTPTTAGGAGDPEPFST